MDEGNLSFSGDEDAANLFITQSSFNSVSTQDVNDALDFFADENDFSFGDDSVKIAEEMSKLSQNSEEMCGRIFDFTGEQHDNGWSVANDLAPFHVTRKSDGQQFIVGKKSEESAADVFEDLHVLPNISRELENDLK